MDRNVFGFLNCSNACCLRDDADKDPSSVNPPYSGYNIPGEREDEAELAAMGDIQTFKDPSSLPGQSGFDPIAVSSKVGSRSEADAIVPPPRDDSQSEKGAPAPDTCAPPEPSKDVGTGNEGTGNGAEPDDWNMLSPPAGESLKKPSEDSREDPVQAEPIEFQVVIMRGTAQLGLEAELEHKSGSLMILEVREGPILDWNKAHPEAKIQHGDVVAAVNGVSGKATEIVQVMKGAEVLHMTIKRQQRAE